MEYLFHALTLSLSPDLKWVSCEQYMYIYTHIYIFYLYIYNLFVYSAILSFGWSISQFTFKIIIDIYVLIAILKIILDYFTDFSSFVFFDAYP